MAFRDAAHIFQRLRTGAVPDRGLDAFAVGIERHRKELGDILDRWIGGIEEGLVDLGVSDTDPAFDTRVLDELDEQLVALTGGRAPADMIRVVRKVFDLKQENRLQDASALVSWLSGSANVAASIKSLAAVKGDIASSDAMTYLRSILEWKGGWKVVPDNFALKIQGDGLSVDAVEAVLDEMRGAGFWSDAETRRKLLSMVPEYRLSKFQRVLPERWQVEMVGGYLLSFAAAATFTGDSATRASA